MRGQGIGAVKFDYGNGVSSFVQADIAEDLTIPATVAGLAFVMSGDQAD